VQDQQGSTSLLDRGEAGHCARPPALGTSLALTAQETQVARLVVEGDTNRMAAAKLFISPATVEYHLRHIYQQLGVSSRTQLARKSLRPNGTRCYPGPQPGRARIVLVGGYAVIGSRYWPEPAAVGSAGRDTHRALTRCGGAAEASERSK